MSSSDWNWLSLGPVPAEESCQQVGRPEYSQRKAREECNRYIDLLRTRFGPVPEGVEFRITRNPHDYGTYLKVCVFYDPSNLQAAEFACRVEAMTRRAWDD